MRECEDNLMPRDQWTAPARIETERLVLRCYTLDDIPALDTVVPANRERLITYLPWAEHEPLAPSARRETVQGFIDGFAAGSDFTLGIFDRATGAYLGGTGLHLRVHLPPDTLEIGYWLAADAEGKGLMTEAAAALTWVALAAMRAKRVEIHCDPANTRSRAVPARLGYVLEDTRHGPCGGDGREALQEIWAITRGTFAGSPASATPRPAIHDAAGHAMDWPQ